jgi:hypothetical protein
MFVGTGHYSVGQIDSQIVADERPRLVLVPVVNSGVVYPVPSSHRDLRLGKPEPLEVAELGLRYLEQKIQEAQAFTKSA